MNLQSNNAEDQLMIACIFYHGSPSTRQKVSRTLIRDGEASSSMVQARGGGALSSPKIHQSL